MFLENVNVNTNEKKLEENLLQLAEYMDLNLEEVTDEDFEALEEILNEGLRTTSIIKRTKKQKLSALVGGAAMSIAKNKKDPMYLKLARFNRQRAKLKAMIAKKYKSQATTSAKKILTRKGKEVSQNPKKQNVDTK